MEKLATDGIGNENGRHGRIEVFEYPADPNAPSHCGGRAGEPRGAAQAGRTGAGCGRPEPSKAGIAREFDQRLAEETRVVRGRPRARPQEGRQAEREAQAAALAAEKQRTRQAPN
jgi:hypothetical protein